MVGSPSHNKTGEVQEQSGWEGGYEHLLAVCAGGYGLLGKMTCTNVMYASSGTTNVACCLYLLLTLLPMPGFVLCVLEC